MDDSEERPEIRELDRKQRRVLGVLLEKAFTTQDSYPLTLKALTTGCNQKSNRSPTTDYDEDTVLDTLEELREMGLTAEVHTSGGRAPRYRHYMRHVFTFSEPQLAILAELMLRGRQQMGELRSRASRMVQIENLAQLREELRGLQEDNRIQANGSLERRGIEVDHMFYPASEAARMEGMSAAPAEAAEPRTPSEPTQQSAPASNVQSSAPLVKELKLALEMLTSEHESLRTRVSELETELERIVRQAGF